MVDTQKGSVTKTNETINNSGIVFKDVGPKGVGSSTISNVSSDSQGNTHFQVSQDAHSSYALGGAVFGSIDNHLNLEVTSDQKVGVDSGSSAKDFPSLEVFKYTVDQNGNISTTQILTKPESGDVNDLKKPERPLQSQEPK